MLHSFSSPFLFHLSTKNLYVSLIIIADKEAHSGKSIKRSKKLKNTVPSLAAYLYWVSIVLIYGGKIFYVEKQLGRAIFFSGYEIIAGIIFTPDIPFVFYFFMTAGNFTLPGALLTVLSREFINSGINFSSIFQYWKQWVYRRYQRHRDAEDSAVCLIFIFAAQEPGERVMDGYLSFIFVHIF